jgi:hypothetical protein
LYKIAISFCKSTLRRKSRMILDEMIIDEAEPELTGYVQVTAVLPVNAIILEKFSKRLLQFIAKHRRSTTSLCSCYWREGKQDIPLRITQTV